MFIPGTPKDLISYCMGLTKIKLSEWILLSTVARIPSIVTSTVGGDALGGQDYRFAILVFAGTLVISLIGGLIYNVYTKRHSFKAGVRQAGRRALNQEDFLRFVSQVATASRLGQEAHYIQHGVTRCLLHSIAVAYYCDCLARGRGPSGSGGGALAGRFTPRLLSI